jgi:hypothetical protein
MDSYGLAGWPAGCKTNENQGKSMNINEQPMKINEHQ